MIRILLVQGLNPDISKLEGVSEACLAEVKGGTPTLLILLRSKKRFAEAFGCPVNVAFSGVETGAIEALVKAVKAADSPYVSGFESSAVNGEGWGIDSFRPARPLHKLSNKMFLPTSTLEAMRSKARVLTGQASDSPARIPSWNVEPQTQFQLWTDEEMATAKKCDPEPVPLADRFKAVLTLLYARSQAAVGRKVGIERGAAWQAALQAASEVGTQQPVSLTLPPPSCLSMTHP
jgi:hypothetical protein